MDYVEILTGLQNRLKGVEALVMHSSISRHEIIYQMNRIHEDIEAIKTLIKEGDK